MDAEQLEAERAGSGRQLGTNQAGMRAQNERLVLSLVRRHGPLAKSDIARITGLSAQTISVIMRQLEADRLLVRGEPQRGRVGQPSVPLALDPEGAFFLGAKVGRRSLEMVLVDFAGNVRERAIDAYPFPVPRQTIARIVATVSAWGAALGPEAYRIAGLGIAMPFQLWTWPEEIGAPAGEMAAWQRTDIRSELAALLPYPVYLQNDATAACGAELAFGGNADLRDFVYIYVGAFVGGGIVLNGSLYSGRTGNAAALGSMPVPDDAGRSVQLIDRASLVLLERRLRAAGRPTAALFDVEAAWAPLEPELDAWIGMAAGGLAYAIASAAAVVDFEAAVIDGALPASILRRLIDEIAIAITRLDLSGIDPPHLRPGTMGPLARALGGASLPLFESYLLDPRAFATPAAPRRRAAPVAAVSGRGF